MRSILKKTKEDSGSNSMRMRLLKFALVTLSVVQGHWPAIACGAATITAAAMFGDKGYMIGLAKQARTMIAEDKPQEAITFLEGKIAKYDRWRQGNLDKAQQSDSILPELFLQLARTKETMGTPIKETIAAYKSSILLTNRSAATAMLWLFAHISIEEYTDVVRKSIQNAINDKDTRKDLYGIIKGFEKSNNWAAFIPFLDSALAEAANPVSAVQYVNACFGMNSSWRVKLLEYCRVKPEFIGFIVQEYEKNAQKYSASRDYRKAAEIYRDIISIYGRDQKKLIYEYKMYDCLFLSGQYKNAISKLERFITDNKATDRTLVIQAIMLKGRSYIQLSEINRAIDIYLTLMIEYPETKQAPESNFFIGYCYMLQGKFEEATESFNLVLKDYPDSTYASKSRLCLTRIKNMTN